MKVAVIESVADAIDSISWEIVMHIINKAIDRKKPLLRSAVALLLFVAFAGAQPNSQPRGFIDMDRNGVNDWFRDVNGDGINDVDGQPYPHSYRFIDANNDGHNDLFSDADGDGVNDLNAHWNDRDGDGWCEDIIDTNRDWINDITGNRYNRRLLGGGRYGFIIEETRQQVHNYRDQDGDGQDDRMQRQQGKQPVMDRFIDADGDGVCDQRGFNQHRRQGQQRPRRSP